MLEMKKNPWRVKDEKSHTNSLIEWWCPEAFFTTIENNKKWHLNSSITEYGKKGKTGSCFKTTIFDLENKIYYENLKYSKKKLDRLEIEEGFALGYYNSYMKGVFPNYTFFLNDKENDIILEFSYKALSNPHWVAQEITNGWLPWGLGKYRYGFIPKCDLNGTMRIRNKKYTIKGVGYFEHVWGRFSFSSPIDIISNLKETISINLKLTRRWIRDMEIKIPKKIVLSSENNPIGYDWIWSIMDNGWTIFYGNILLWIMRGPAFGTLILSKDDANYNEYTNISFKYNKIKHSNNYDFYYPTEIELIAKKGREKLNLIFTMNNECREFIQKIKGSNYWKAFVICESPGTVKGSYKNDNQKITLNGICKIEPQRQVSIFGHNSLELDFIKPPKGVGIKLDLYSHFLNKYISSRIQLSPKINIKIKVKETSINENK
jgi:hypothetical protein